MRPQRSTPDTYKRDSCTIKPDMKKKKSANALFAEGQQQSGILVKQYTNTKIMRSS